MTHAAKQNIRDVTQPEHCAVRMLAVFNSGRAEHSCGEKTRDRIQSKREILNRNDFRF